MDSMKEVYDGIKKLITISERIEGHTEDIAEIKEKVTENTGDTAEIKGKLEGIERRLDSVEARLDSMDSELISLKIGQKEMGTDIRTIKDRLEVKEEIYAIKERLSLLEGEVKTGKIKA